jgi:hypothetical protein
MRLVRHVDFGLIREPAPGGMSPDHPPTSPCCAVGESRSVRASAPTTEGLSQPPPSWYGARSGALPDASTDHRFQCLSARAYPMCKHLMSLCISQPAEMACLEAERRANGEQRHFTPAARSDPAPFAARVLPHADAAPASPWWPELCPPRRQFLGRNSAAGDTNGGSATRR